MKTRATDMAKIGRLLKRADFLRVQAAGRKWVTPHFIIQIADKPADTGPEICRLGMTVTKKIFANATDRNRVRRRFRALFLDILAENPPQNLDFILLPRVTGIKAPREDLEKDLKWAVRRLLSPETGKKTVKTAEKSKNDTV